jgi:hypothetical protein
VEFRDAIFVLDVLFCSLMRVVDGVFYETECDGACLRFNELFFF